jgi:hypothetical protein
MKNNERRTPAGPREGKGPGSKQGVQGLAALATSVLGAEAAGGLGAPGY